MTATAPARPSPRPAAPHPAGRAGATGPAGVTTLVGPVVPGVLAGAALLAGGLRLAGSDLPTRVGPALLVAAVLVGLPHGALDTALVTARRGSRRGAGVGLAYLLAAIVAWAAWWRWPVAGLAALLAVSAAHFALADLATTRWTAATHAGAAATRDGAGRRWAAASAAASGVLAVAGPFAWWPARTGPVLARLGVGADVPGLTAACRVAVAAAAVTALAALPAAWAGRARGEPPDRDDRAGRTRPPVAALEPFVLLALTSLCPPLTAFALYFAGWHALRQSARLLVLHPEAAWALRTGGWRPAAVLLARRAVLPTAVALIALAALALDGGGVTAALLAGLLAVSVPHAVVTALQERRAAR